MDKMQPLEVFGNDLASLKMNLGQKEQKFSKKAENGFLALILSNDSKMSSYFVRNDNFCMQKPWEAQMKKKNFCGKKNSLFWCMYSFIVICINLSEFCLVPPSRWHKFGLGLHLLKNVRLYFWNGQKQLREVANTAS